MVKNEQFRHVCIGLFDKVSRWGFSILTLLREEPPLRVILVVMGGGAFETLG